MIDCHLSLTQSLGLKILLGVEQSAKVEGNICCPEKVFGIIFDHGWFKKQDDAVIELTTTKEKLALAVLEDDMEEWQRLSLSTLSAMTSAFKRMDSLPVDMQTKYVFLYVF